MKRLIVLAAFITLVLVSCSGERGVEPIDTQPSVQLDPEFLAEELIAQTGWPDEDDQVRTPVGCGYIIGIERQEILPGIAHYSYQLKIGLGDYDVIGLHRVVKEKKPYWPVRTCKSVFLQHGDAVGFEGVFLFGAVAPSVPDDQAIAVYLAKNNVDVWGIDQPWVMVPAETADFSFMADWGMQYHIDNLEVALAVARFTRMITGGGSGRMPLLGYSSGASLGYAYLNHEISKPEPCRHVDGFIPVDIDYKTANEDGRLSACRNAAENEDQISAGMYNTAITFVPIALLAINDPDGESPLAPGSGLTNYIVALLAGSATHMLADMSPGFHYVAGEFDVTGLPTGFQFMTVETFFDFMLGASFHQPVAFIHDYHVITCDEEDSPFDDYLGDITVPVFSLNSAGGFGEDGFYTTTLLGSTDIVTLNIQLYPSEYQMIDYGHIDMFAAENAEELVWTPVLNWINDHSCRRGKGDKSFKKD